MTLTTKTAKGAKLTPAEIDANWTEIDGRLIALETNPPEAVSIASMSVTDNNKLRITLTDNSVLGPFTLPTANFNYKAAWLPETGYLANDIISYDNSLYIVLYPHTSDAEFDPGAGDGQGQHYYSLIMTVPYAGSWQGELDYGIVYRRGDTFKRTIGSIITVYSVNIQHETVAPFNAARQISGNNVYSLQYAFSTSSGSGTFRGTFADTAEYAVDDWFSVAGTTYTTIYRVLVAHVAAAPFDADAENSNNEPLYEKMFVALTAESGGGGGGAAEAAYLDLHFHKESLSAVSGGSIIQRWVIPESCTWEEYFSGCYCVGSASGDETVLSILHGTTVIGTITFSAYGSTGTFDQSEVPATVNAGDTVALRTPIGGTTGFGEVTLVLRLPTT